MQNELGLYVPIGDAAKRLNCSQSDLLRLGVVRKIAFHFAGSERHNVPSFILALILHRGMGALAVFLRTVLLFPLVAILAVVVFTHRDDWGMAGRLAALFLGGVAGLVSALGLRSIIGLGSFLDLLSGHALVIGASAIEELEKDDKWHLLLPDNEKPDIDAEPQAEDAASDSPSIAAEPAIQTRERESLLGIIGALRIVRKRHARRGRPLQDCG
jgi:hypothetical protein